MTRVEIIVAVRNEEQAIPAFVDKIATLPLPRDVDVKVVFVEDSSTDGTRPLLRRLASENPRVGFYTVAPGLGQGPAVIFGLSRSTADAMIMMDVDGSHPVDVIPEMIRAFLAGAQVVQCVRRRLVNRRIYRRVGAAVFHLGVRLLTGSDPTEQNIFFRLVSAGVARQLLEQPRYWVYLRFPLPRGPEGAHKIQIDTQERVLGESKYGLGRLAKLAIDGILSQMSRERLLVLVVAAGLLAAVCAAAGMWVATPVLTLGILWILDRYTRLWRSDLLQLMEVVECGNVPAVAAAVSPLAVDQNVVRGIRSP